RDPRGSAVGGVRLEQALPQVPGMPPTHLELGPLDDDDEPAPFEADLLDVVGRDEGGPVDADESGRLPTLLERVERDADEVRTGRGVQACVVALCLRETDLAAVDEPGHSAELDRDGLVLDLEGGGVAAAQLADHASRGLMQAILAD